jgi:transcriptional regulator NrdR family protein
MYCPECRNEQIKTTNVRSKKLENAIRRRRECQICGHRWTTMETIIKEEKDKEINPMVAKFFGDD